MLPEIDIQKLVSEAQAGDSSAFGAIYDAYSRPLYNFLFSKIRHQQTTEDLVHTVFLKAWSNLKSYRPRPDAKFSTWLYQIANFTLIDHWRTRKITTELTGVENLAQFASDPKLYEEYGYLWAATAQLSLAYQTVLDLRFRQDLSVAETARIMRKSAISVRVLQHRALKALRIKIKKRL